MAEVCSSAPAAPGASDPPRVTVEITYVDALPPQAEAARQWFLTEVRARLARRREQIPPEDAA